MHSFCMQRIRDSFPLQMLFATQVTSAVQIPCAVMLYSLHLYKLINIEYKVSEPSDALKMK